MIDELRERLNEFRASSAFASSEDVQWLVDRVEEAEARADRARAALSLSVPTSPGRGFALPDGEVDHTLTMLDRPQFVDVPVTSPTEDEPDCAECGVGEATKNCVHGCRPEQDKQR